MFKLLVKGCTCELPSLGQVDGDNQTVYCARCEGVIATHGEIMLTPNPDTCAHKHTEVEEVSFSYLQGKPEFITYCTDCETIIECPDLELN